MFKLVCFPFKCIRESRITDTLLSKKCEITRSREQSLALYSGAWFYFFSKIIDLLDTCFFVLRKKQNQVTFLHVYHHTITALFSWMYLKYAPGMYFQLIGKGEFCELKSIYPFSLRIQVSKVLSSAFSTQASTSSCTSTTWLPPWVPNTKSTCGGRST